MKDRKMSFYNRIVKRMLDIICSLAAIKEENMEKTIEKKCFLTKYMNNYARFLP